MTLRLWEILFPTTLRLGVGKSKKGLGRLGRPVESITDPGFSGDVVRMIRIWFDLLSKALYEDSKVVDLVAVVRSPHGLQEFPMG